VSGGDGAGSEVITQWSPGHGNCCWCQDCLYEPEDLHAEASSDDGEGIATVDEIDGWMYWAFFDDWEPWPEDWEETHDNSRDANIFW
jgi:hypothetical protein